MRHKGCMLVAVFTLFLGFVAPVWAIHTADPLEEFYSQHVLPYYNVGTGFASFAVFTDTSFTEPADTANIHLYFFDKTCALVRDHVVPVTANGVVLLPLNAPALAGIPNEGVIFADTSPVFGNAVSNNERFLAYILLINLTDNTLTRIDSIPFSPGLAATSNFFAPVPGTGHWTRYDSFNTVAATFGDSTSPTIFSLRTTLTFFNAIGGTPTKTRLGAKDTLREFMLEYGAPRVGDWVTTGTSGTSNVTPGIIELDAFSFGEVFLGSFRLNPNCFERVRLRDVLPVLASGPAGATGGHIVAFSLPDAGRTATCPAGQCGFSGFQETVVEVGGVDASFSGYFHHSP